MGRAGRMTLVVLAFLVAASWTVQAGDWPQWRGPNRDAICTETGLLKQWPEGGPKLLWKLEGLGMGYSAVSIAGGRIFTMGDREADGAKKQFVIAYTLADHKEAWATAIGGPHKDGSRCTPTLDGGRAYAIGTDGVLVCLDAGTGKLQWEKNFAKDFDGRMMSGWRWSESPLIDGDQLICTPGGNDAALVALNKLTGDLIWKAAVPDLGPAGKPGAGYSSAIVAEVDGVRQYIQLFGKGVFGVEARTGKFLWGYNKVANGVANITTPVIDGNLVFASTQYKTGSVILKLTRDGDGMKAEEVKWFGADEFQNHHGGVIVIDGHVYGGTNKNGGPPTCISLKDAKIVWQEKAPASGSAAYLHVDGHFIVRYESGPVTLVQATPEGHRIVSTFTPEKSRGPAWPHPVVHGGKLYLRHADILLCYDLRAN